MSERPLSIRPFQTADEAAIVSLWQLCELTVPWNNPYKDIARKLKVQPELFLVGMLESFLTASVMG
ncbi:MAG: acetyltransferase GCN5, partial [SAR324 cluster bacterium]|nr:acetyltransferase GCN5 [SAR324 cluster bacterium]